MKPLAYFLTVIFLCSGSLAATTAYHVSLEEAQRLVDEGRSLVLSADAGLAIAPSKEFLDNARQHKKIPTAGMRFWEKVSYASLLKIDKKVLAKAKRDPDNRVVFIPAGKGNFDPVPLLRKDQELTKDDVSALFECKVSLGSRGTDVEYVSVKANTAPELWEQLTQRWQGRWIFLASVVGLAAAAWFMNRDGGTKKAIDDPSLRETPEQALHAAAETLHRLRDGVPPADLLNGLDDLQKTHLNAFVEARPQLIARLGLARFAEVMDAFAAAERHINRAWSATADGVPEEARESLRRASELLQLAIDRASMTEQQT